MEQKDETINKNSSDLPLEVNEDTNFENEILNPDATLEAHTDTNCTVYF
jgi:hypothetical protein